MQIGSDSESTASTADVAALAGENGMDDLAGDGDAASFRYIRLVIYAARNVLAKDRSGFSDPWVYPAANNEQPTAWLELDLMGALHPGLLQGLMLLQIC